MIIELIFNAFTAVLRTFISVVPSFPSIGFIVLPLTWIINFMADGAGMIWWLLGADFMNSVAVAYVTTFVGFRVYLVVAFLRNFVFRN